MSNPTTASTAPQPPDAATDAPAGAGRVAIVTLGCGRNEVDSDQLAGLFHRGGAQVVDDPETADVVLVNTCTFIAPAKQESIDTVLEACQLKDDGAARAVLVVGCMAQRYPQELADAIPEADAIVGFDGYGRLPAIVDDVLAGRVTERVIGAGAPHPGSRPARRDLPLMVAPTPTSTADAGVPAPAAHADGRATPSGTATVQVGGAGASVLGLTVTERVADAHDDAVAAATSQDLLDRVPDSGPRFPVRRFDGGPWAYLKIASGCDRVCTFCAIPSFRGRFRSRPLAELVAEASWLVEQGARELVLVSENTTSWGKDLGGRDLQPQLLETLGEVDGLERLRLMYLQPAELTRPLMETIATHPKVASYFDLSLQHVAGPVVSRMGRSGDHERFGELITTIRELDPGAVFRSNFILGFPGETDHDVDVLEDFLTEHLLDWVGLFTFSREDGTPSDDLPDQVDETVATDRVRRIADVQERLADAAARRFVGRRLEVVVEEAGGEDLPAVGRSYREAPDTDGEVRLLSDDGTAAQLPVGRTVTARVVDAVGVDLVAEVGVADAGPARG